MPYSIHNIVRVIYNHHDFAIISYSSTTLWSFASSAYICFDCGQRIIRLQETSCLIETVNKLYLESLVSGLCETERNIVLFVTIFKPSCQEILEWIDLLPLQIMSMPTPSNSAKEEQRLELLHSAKVNTPTSPSLWWKFVLYDIKYTPAPKLCSIHRTDLSLSIDKVNSLV